MKKILLLFMVTLFISGCRYGIYWNQMLAMNPLAEHFNQRSLENTPLTDSDHEKLQTYFENAKTLIYALQFENQFTYQLHREFFRYYYPKLCLIAFKPATYDYLKNHCLVNGLYLCEEELKYYVDLLKIVKKHLTLNEWNLLNKDQKCRELLAPYKL